MRLARLLDVATESDVGRKRTNNEDCHRVAVHQTPQGSLILLAVADGMGGGEAGELASRLAIESVAQATKTFADYLSSGKTPINLEQVMDRAFKLAQLRATQEITKNPALKGMGSTLTAVLITDWNKNVVVGHIGDTRAYKLSKSAEWSLITQDHSWVAMQIRTGMMTEEEAETHPWKNMLTQAIGLDNIEYDIKAARFASGEYLMLSTDGLHGLVPPKEWVLDTNLQVSLEQWVGKALKRGGTDNITAILARFV